MKHSRNPLRDYYAQLLSEKYNVSQKFIRNFNDDEGTVAFFETDFAFCDIKYIP